MATFWWGIPWWPGATLGTTTAPALPSPPVSLIAAINIALTSIGDDPITALDEDSARARAALLVAEPLLDELLREHDWNFARIRTPLVPLSTGPAFGYQYQFALPTNPYCLMVRRTSLDEQEPYAIEQSANGQRILAANEATVSILYTARILDSSMWDPLFRMAYANRLAAELAYPITSKADFAATLWQKTEARLRRAKAVDAIEGRRKLSFLSDILTRDR